MPAPFRVGITADFKTEATGLLEPALAEVFDARPDIEVEFFPTHKAEVTPDQIRDYDAVIVLAARFTAASLAGVERLAALARWGVGYDNIDVAACTANDVLLCITPNAVQRPVAEGILTLLLNLTHHVRVKEDLIRAGRWSEKSRYPGIGLGGRTLGSVGVGNIGAELFRLLQPFGLGRTLAYDPYVSPAQAAALGVEMVTLDTLLAESDVVCINCPLNAETHHLIGEAQLRRMRPIAYLVNTARGPIIDQQALTRALQERWIAGAALDVFEVEPLPPDDPLTRLDNVVLSPHGIAWTVELGRDNSLEACTNVLTLLGGSPPRHTVNRAVIERPGFQAKLQALRDRGAR